jgi:hypothetical protein
MIRQSFNCDRSIMSQNTFVDNLISSSKLLKVIGLIDCMGGGPHYLCTRKGHIGTLWGGIGTCTGETHPYSAEVPFP